MAFAATAPTSFVTGADGFVGIELLKLLVTRGHHVIGLAESVDAATRIRHAGATPVLGSLREAGQWQDEASADWVFHLVPESGPPPNRRRATPIARDRAAADARLLDVLAAGSTRRIVYAVDAGIYGAAGVRPITEDVLRSPSAFAPALDRVEGYIAAGLPIVVALPGRVYGNGSWFREHVITPVLSNRRVLQVGRTGPCVSPIHVHDCARALIHLAQSASIGSRYFLVNRDPVRLHEFAETCARIARRQLRVWRLPAVAARLTSHPLLRDYLRPDAALSNIRLRGIGFTYRYPTLDQGIEQILGALDEQLSESFI